MATTSFTQNPIVTTDAEAKSFVTNFLTAMDGFSNLTKVTDQLTRHTALTSPFGGGANLNVTDKTLSAGTITSSLVLTGTWSSPIVASDLGRMIKIPGAGAAGAMYYGFIAAVDTAAQSVTLQTATSTAVTAGTVVATIGVLFGSPTTNVSTYYGSVIYRFNDSLQSTHPIFIKFSLGQYGNAAATSLLICSVQVGSYLDGYGQLVNGRTQEYLANLCAEAVSGTTGDSATARLWYFSCANGRFSVIANQDNFSSAQRGFFTVSRGVNESDVQIGDFANIIWQKANTLRQWILHRASTQIYPSTGGWNNLVAGNIPSEISNFVYNGDTSIVPAQPMIGSVKPHCGDVILAKLADFVNGAISTIDGKVYMSMPGTVTGTTFNGMSLMTFLVRYE